MARTEKLRSRDELLELVKAQQLLIEQLNLRLSELDDQTDRFETTREQKLGADRSVANGNVAFEKGADEVVAHAPAACESCGLDLSGAVVVSTELRRVVELSAVRLQVTDHILELRVCDAGHETQAAAPGVLARSVSYGPGLRSFAAYLSLHQHLPLDQTSEILSDVLGHAFSVTDVAEIVSEM
jgi:transposase